MTILLTNQERKILELLIHGNQNKQIAESLGISIRTVEFHCSNIYSKLGVDGRVYAILWAIESGFFEQ